VKVSDFHFFLPPDRVAVRPAEPRDSARLLLMERFTGGVHHSIFHDLPELLPPRSLIVLNDTAVFPARLRGRKPTGGMIEILLTRRLAAGGDRQDTDEEWEALARGLGGALPVGATLTFAGGLTGKLVSRGEAGAVRIRLSVSAGGSALSLAEAVDHAGEVPLPPYIETARKRAAEAGWAGDDRASYQTVYATSRGAVAAPTAGLHFTVPLLERIQAAGHEIARLTLHVGPGTFRPVNVEDVALHEMDPEHYTIPAATAAAVERARAAGRPVVAVGTTVVRALESAAQGQGGVRSGPGTTRLFLYPGATFAVVTDLVTNFHLPRSTLLMLVCAFAGRERVLAAYAEAVEAGYRFYSYGDAMLIRSMGRAGA
jgi:S-adenosylmethionine:tRNA ribosyltransferase-isomerase